MKRVILPLVIIAILAVYGGVSVMESATDVLKQLGISDEEAGDFVWWNLSGEVFSYPNMRELKQKSGAEKSAVMQEVCEYARRYTESESFKQKYLEQRENRKPSPPQKPEPVEEMRARLKKDGEKSIKEMEASLASMPAEHQEMMKATIDMMKEQVKQYDDPNNPMFSKDMEQMMMQGYEMQMDQHKKDLAEWEENNPTDPTAMVKKRLEKFLEETKDVDFNAQVVDGQYGKKVFAKREYEMKPSNWKVCYRAGREPVETTRAFARQWLGDLNKK